MINIQLCKNKAKNLAISSKEKIGYKTVQELNDSLEKIIEEYSAKYQFHSTAIKLECLDPFEIWLKKILDIKSDFTPIIIDKMVSEGDLYSLSIYQNLYKNTDSIPNMFEYQSQYYSNGGGEHSLALITGCHWMVENGLLE